MTTNPTHLDKIRQRFTDTANVFAESARTMRVEEGARLAELATAGLPGMSEAFALDVACGPGTFTRPLAARVHRVVGIDLTPAMVEKARSEAVQARTTNIEFACGDVYALPFPDGIASVVACGYAIHHIQDPERAIAEMARVLRPGGRVAIADLIVPEGPGGEIQNAIERVRDPSHANTQTISSFHALMQGAGLRVLAAEPRQHWYDFDKWMHNAGIAPGDATYIEVRRMMEAIMDHDTSGLIPRLSPETGKLEFLHTVLLIVGEKPA